MKVWDNKDFEDFEDFEDQGTIRWFFSYRSNFPNEVLPIFLCLKYYLEFLEKKTPDPGVPL